jgi:RimJ/RimL family protein N-acetyltransferase
VTATRNGQRVRLRSGDRVLVRPLRPDDRARLAAAVKQMSDESRYRRFHIAMRELSEPMLDYLIDIDHHDHEALAALPPGTGEIVGVARFIRDPDKPDTAELSITVADSWQRRGLGTLLLRHLGRRAAEVGVSQFTAEILAGNAPTLRLVDQLGDADMTADGPIVTARMDVTEWPGAKSGAGPLLRSLARGETVLLPWSVRAWLGLPAKLTRTLLVPVKAVLRRRRRAEPRGVAKQARRRSTQPDAIPRSTHARPPNTI